MALNIDIRINSEFPIVHIEALRMSGGSEPEDLNSYDVEVWNKRFDVLCKIQEFTVYEHRYGDGALQLMKRIMELVEV